MSNTPPPGGKEGGGKDEPPEAPSSETPAPRSTSESAWASELPPDPSSGLLRLPLLPPKREKKELDTTLSDLRPPSLHSPLPPPRAPSLGMSRSASEQQTPGPVEDASIGPTDREREISEGGRSTEVDHLPDLTGIATGGVKYDEREELTDPSIRAARLASTAAKKREEELEEDREADREGRRDDEEEHVSEPGDRAGPVPVAPSRRADSRASERDPESGPVAPSRRPEPRTPSRDPESGPVAPSRHYDVTPGDRADLDADEPDLAGPAAAPIRAPSLRLEHELDDTSHPSPPAAPAADIRRRAPAGAEEDSRARRAEKRESTVEDRDPPGSRLDSDEDAAFQRIEPRSRAAAAAAGAETGDLPERRTFEEGELDRIPETPVPEAPRAPGPRYVAPIAATEPEGPPPAAPPPSMQPAQPPYRPPRPPPTKGPPIGWMLLALFVGLGMGTTCATCATSLPGRSTDEIAGEGKHRVGVVELSGAITDTTDVVRAVRELSRRDDLDALVIRIDSPGGAVAPSQELYEALRSASKTKPVVCSMGNVAASGGYWSALGADWIVASAGSVVGSIGVISQTPDLRALAELIHFDLRTYKSGPLKDLGNPLREMTPRDEALFMGLIADIYDQFVSLVAERRKLDLEAVKNLADGRVLTGRAALDAGLIDQVGGLYDAAEKAVYLALKRKEADKEPKDEDIKDPTLVYPRKPSPGILRLLAEDTGRGFFNGVEHQARTAAESFRPSPTVELR